MIVSRQDHKTGTVEQSVFDRALVLANCFDGRFTWCFFYAELGIDKMNQNDTWYHGDFPIKNGDFP